MTTIDDGEFGNYISVAEAARMVGTTTQAMSNLVLKGYFTTKTVAGRILVLRSEVGSFVPSPKGRPTKKMQTTTKSSKRPPEVIDRRNSGKYISQADAARIRGVSKQAIANLINRGRLNTVGVAGRTLVIRSEVEAFVPQPVGHPLKKKPEQKKSKK
jgi:plasmid maintenance system antidote protein VapI